MSRDLPHAAGAKFEAKFDGRCKGCDTAVYVGDMMQYIDDEAVCEDCGDAAVAANHEVVRDNARRWQEEERARQRAKDPAKFDAQEARVKAFVDSVRKTAEEHPGKDWVPSPNGQGFVNVTHPLYERAETVCPTCHLVQPCDCEPATPTEQEDSMAVEPGIQALMAAGLLEGQEPGGSGVCNAEIITPDGKVTEVAIPVPVTEEAPAKAPRKRASRAKPKPEPEAPAESVPSTGSVEDAAAAALARVREAAPQLVEPVPTVIPNAARLAQLEAAAKDWDPAKINAEVQVAAQPDALQAGLQAAVDAGTMEEFQALALGWIPPTVQTEIRAAQVQDAALAAEIAQADAAMGGPNGLPIGASTPRTLEPLHEFMADPGGNPAADIFLDALAAAKSAPEEDAILGALDNLAPYEGMPRGVEEAKASILGVIEEAIENHPRSLQTTIGPSEIGTECDHCLAAKLAEWRQVRDGSPWLPTVGTAVHTWLEEVAFRRIMLDAFGRPRYLMERKVAVGEIDGVEVTGSTDLVDLVRGMTWDWKIVGKTTLTSAKAGPSLRYKVQQMLYARGWRRLGVLITHVGIAYLPRNEVSLRKAVLWTAEYDESLAEWALERASNMARNVKAMATLGVETRDKYITSLDRYRSWRERDPVSGVEKLVYGNAQEGKIECLDCARYEDYPEDPNAAINQLEGLL